jgi:hypothetical protein
MFSQIKYKGKSKTCDHWNTPKTAVDAVVHLIPKGSVVYEPFTNDTSKSHVYLQEHGFKTVSHIGDFYNDPPDFDIILTNPAFSDIQRALSRLFELGKPFILIVPLSLIVRNYFRQYRDRVSILIPAKRIQFESENSKNRSPFDCVYITNLPMEKLIYLEMI